MRYNFEMYYTPGKQLVTADTLTRKPLYTTTDTESKEIEKDSEEYIQSVIKCLPIAGHIILHFVHKQKTKQNYYKN